MAMAVPIGYGIALFISQWNANDGNLRESIAGTVPGVVTMVPEGLVLMTSIAFAVARGRTGGPAAGDGRRT